MSQLKPANEYLIGGGTGGVKPPPGLTYLLIFNYAGFLQSVL